MNDRTLITDDVGKPGWRLRPPKPTPTLLLCVLSIVTFATGLYLHKYDVSWAAIITVIMIYINPFTGTMFFVGTLCLFLPYPWSYLAVLAGIIGIIPLAQKLLRN